MVFNLCLARYSGSISPADHRLGWLEIWILFLIIWSTISHGVCCAQAAVLATVIQSALAFPTMGNWNLRRPTNIVIRIRGLATGLGVAGSIGRLLTRRTPPVDAGRIGSPLALSRSILVTVLIRHNGDFFFGRHCYCVRWKCVSECRG
jgi:hypothetical protein